MKKLFLLASLLIAQESISPTTVYFSSSLNPSSPQIQKCSPFLVNLIKSSDYDFKQWGEASSVKNQISFLFDTWDPKEILIKLFFDYTNPMQGSGTIAWIRYNLQTQEMNEVITETKLTYDKAINSRFQDCLAQNHKESQ